MKVRESFAVEATPEVRKDPRFEWYVNWIEGLENNTPFIKLRTQNCRLVGLDINMQTNTWPTGADGFEEIKTLTLDEVYSRYGKEIYKANGIEQSFQGSREYDFKLVEDFEDWWGDQTHDSGHTMFREYINQKHNTDILKQIAEHKAKIEELEKQLR